MEYKILNGNNITFNDFEKKVNKEINNGWKPIGGINVTDIGRGVIGEFCFAQAMIKEIEEESKYNNPDTPIVVGLS